MSSSTVPACHGSIWILYEVNLPSFFQSKAAGERPSFGSAERASAGEGRTDPELEPGLATCSTTGVVMRSHFQMVHLPLV